MKRWIYHSRASFEAEHALTLYLGEAETLHRHRWKIEVQIGVEELNREYYGLDFRQVHEILEEEINRLHKKVLNEISEIGKPSPSAENLALFLSRRLTPSYRKVGGELLRLSVWEGPKNRVDLLLGNS